MTSSGARGSGTSRVVADFGSDKGESVGGAAKDEGGAAAPCRGSAGPPNVGGEDNVSEATGMGFSCYGEEGGGMSSRVRRAATLPEGDCFAALVQLGQTAGAAFEGKADMKLAGSGEESLRKVPWLIRKALGPDTGSNACCPLVVASSPGIMSLTAWG